MTIRKRKTKGAMIITLLILAVISIVIFGILKQSKFGKLPSGEQLEVITESPNYRNGSFQNIHHTPDITEGYTYFSVLYEFLFTKRPRLRPIDSIPSTKVDLIHLDPKEDVLVWFGHSSYFMQIDGKKMLIDPVFSGYASPFSFATKAFKGTDPYSTDDIPEIDYLFITHDHWDHLDYQALKNLKPKINKVICGLGVGGHLEHWGYKRDIIIEKDWNEGIDLDTGFMAHTAPARHFSGRAFRRNKTLWTSFVLETPTMKIYIGGDSGYDTHFAEIGEAFGEFDLVILENGQYDEKWKYIHMMPGEVLQAAKDLNAKRLFPVHSSKFAISHHPWDDPLKQITELNKEMGQILITPIIGEKVYLKDTTKSFNQWWVEIK